MVNVQPTKILHLNDIIDYLAETTLIQPIPNSSGYYILSNDRRTQYEYKRISYKWFFKVKTQKLGGN